MSDFRDEDPEMGERRSKSNAPVVMVFAVLVIIPSLAWKPIVTGGWRLGNPTTAKLADKRLTFSWPWMTTKAAEPIKLRAFATQWPGTNNDFATALISMSSSNDISLSDSEWFAQSKSRYKTHGFGDVREVSFSANGVVCAQAMSEKIESDYCRSKQGYDIAFIGPHALLVNLVNSLSSNK
jgi:hypothetical protein